ncbi:MAG: hypothetical protein ACM3S3_08920 [Candidatus Doudnabacteria bacterium]|jgi:hypothetical protein
MERLRKPGLVAPLLLVALTVAASAALGSWLPIVTVLPWLVAIAWFGSRDAGAPREFPSAAEASRERLWA